MLDQYWEELLDPQDPLLAYRKKGWDRFQTLGLPRLKQEAFQYVRRNWVFPKLAERKTASTGGSGLVFVDGFFEETLSQIPAPLVCVGLVKAIRTYGLFLQSRLALTLDRETDPFAALNGAFLGKGAFLYVPPKCKAALHLHHRYTEETLASPRLHVYVGRGAELRLVQETEGKSGFSNGVLDLVLDQGARCTYIDRGASDLQALRVSLKRDSFMQAVLLSQTLRTSVRMELLEENSEAKLFALARLQGEEERHLHAHMEHVAPHTRSRQHVKSVLKGKSRFSFEGKIYVHKEAQKTESYQLNNNLLLSDDAHAFAKPNLEIFADDVKASHGATVGQLNAEDLFYLRSRGLSKQLAEEWLIEGFCREIYEHAR